MRKRLFCLTVLALCILSACGKDAPAESTPTPTPELDVNAFLRGENKELIEVLGDGQE